MSVNFRWKLRYIAASQSVGDEGEKGAIKPEAGSFDLSSFEKAEQNLFSDYKTSSVCLLKNAVTFSKECVKAMDCGNYVELLVHPLKKLLAVRPAEEKSKCTVKWARLGKTTSISCQAFIRTLFDIFDWNMDLKYKLYGTIFRDDKNCAGIFSATDPSMFISQERVTNVPGQLIGTVGKRVQVFDKDFGQCFGKGYYEKKTMRELQNLSHDEWKTRLEGRTCLSEKDLNITPYEKLRNFIKSELGDLFEEVETA